MAEGKEPIELEEVKIGGDDAAAKEEAEKKARDKKKGIKWKSKAQQKVLESLNSIHQLRHTRLRFSAHYGRTPASKRDARIYTWYGRPEVVTQDKDRGADVYKTFFSSHKLNGAGIIDQLMEYDHSMLDVMLFNETNRLGYDVVTTHWYKPGVHCDFLNIDLNLKGFSCSWLTPDKKGEEEDKSTLDITCSYPPKFRPALVRVTLGSNMVELNCEKGQMDMRFFEGRTQATKPGETLVQLVLDDFLRLKKGGKLENYRVGVSISLNIPASTWKEGYKTYPGSTERQDRELEGHLFKELLSWQRPLPRSFCPVITPSEMVIVSCTRHVTFDPAEGVWELGPPDDTDDPTTYNRL